MVGARELKTRGMNKRYLFIEQFLLGTKNAVLNYSNTETVMSRQYLQLRAYALNLSKMLIDMISELWNVIGDPGNSLAGAEK